MITPNAACAAFCYWLLNVSWQSLSGTQRALVQTISAASIAQTPVTLQAWLNFNKFTAWRFPFYQVYASLATESARPLDIWPGAEIAFSFRRLNSAYSGPCVTARRAADGALMAIGFFNEFIDTATLLTFSAGDNVTLQEWWDQSGNSNNASQATVLNQPLLVNAGSLIVENTLPALQWDSVQTCLDLLNPIFPGASQAGWQVSAKGASGNNGTLFAGSSGAVSPYMVYPFSDDHIYASNLAIQLASIGAVDNGAQNCYWAGIDNLAGSILLNAAAVPINVAPSVRAQPLDTIGRWGFNGSFSSGTAQEVIYYTSDQTANAVSQSNNAKSAFLIP